VLTLGELGHDVTVIGRSALAPLHKATLFARDHVRYEAMDVFAPACQPRLREIADTADVFVMGAEPQTVEQAGLDDAVRGVKRVYATLLAASYAAKDNAARKKAGRWPKRVVRIGSPPAEIPCRSFATCKVSRGLGLVRRAPASVGPARQLAERVLPGESAMRRARAASRGRWSRVGHGFAHRSDLVGRRLG
jgi:hypothetical protein